MIYKFSTERYTFEKKRCCIKASDDLYAICYSFTITTRDIQQQIRKSTYLLEHSPECTSFDCIDKSYSSVDDILAIFASEYFFYINFVSQNSVNDPYYDLVVSAEKDDFYSIFDQNGKNH